MGVCRASGFVFLSAVLCSHSAAGSELYAYEPEGPAFDYYMLTPLGNAECLDNYLDEKQYALADLLTQGPFKGILLLYVLPMNVWKSMLEFVSAAIDDEHATPPKDVQDLFDAAEAHRQKLPAVLKDERRVRIETPLDLLDILKSVRLHLGKARFQKWFGHVTYDAPKLAGWVARIRGLGNDIPVMRIDEGVLFNFHTAWKTKMDGVRALVHQTVRDYLSSVVDVFTQSFVLSQQYTGVHADNGTIPFDTWNEAYATQACAVLLATEAMCSEKQFYGTFPEAKYFPSSQEVERATSGEVMRAFYGVEKTSANKYLTAKLPSDAEDDEERRELDASMGITYVGGNPTHSLISGAGLTTGPGVAMDMPPMIHTDLFIMWIDDHLLERMTAEVLATKRRMPPTGSEKARWPDVRPPQRNPARFVLEFYMPTLTMGTIFDAWINNHPDAHLLKFAGEDLPKKLQSKLEALKPADGQALGPFTRAMQRSRFLGAVPDGQELSTLEEDLWSSALKRLADDYWLWGQLPQPEVDGKATPSFATLWATGRVCKQPHLQKYCESGWSELSKPCAGKFCAALAKGMVKEGWDAKAKAAKKRRDLPALTKDDLNPAFKDKVAALIVTAKTHIEWTVDWTLVCQAIRSLPAGSVRTDTEYKSAYLESLPITAYEVPQQKLIV